MLPPLVSIVTPMPLLTPALEMVPLLVSELLELMVTAAVLLVPMATLPVASMVMLPLVEVSSGVEGPALSIRAVPPAGVLQRLVGGPLADGQGERVGDSPHQLPVVVRLGGSRCGVGGGIGALHDVPSLMRNLSFP